MSAVSVQSCPLSARMDGSINPELAGHADLVRREELLGIFLDCGAQALADDASQDFSYSDRANSAFWLFESEEFGARQVFSEVGWGAALCKQLNDVGQLLYNSRLLRRRQGFKQVLYSEA